MRVHLVLACATLPLLAQSLPQQDIFRASTPIVIDGRLDEAAWRDAPGITDFHFNWWKEGNGFR